MGISLMHALDIGGQIVTKCQNRERRGKKDTLFTHQEYAYSLDHFDREILCVVADWLAGKEDKSKPDSPPAPINPESVRRFSYNRWILDPNEKRWLFLKSSLIYLIVKLAEIILRKKIWITDDQVKAKIVQIRDRWHQVIKEKFPEYIDYMAKVHLEGCKSLQEANIIILGEEHRDVQWQIFTTMMMMRFSEDRKKAKMLLEAEPRDATHAEIDEHQRAEYRLFLTLSNSPEQVEFSGWEEKNLKDYNEHLVIAQKHLAPIGRHEYLGNARTTSMMNAAKEEADKYPDGRIFVAVGQGHVFNKSGGDGGIQTLIQDGFKGRSYAILSPKFLNRDYASSNRAM